MKTLIATVLTMGVISLSAQANEEVNLEQAAKALTLQNVAKVQLELDSQIKRDIQVSIYAMQAPVITEATTRLLAKTEVKKQQETEVE